MKKVFWKVLCILICCCVFSACGKSAGGSEPALQEENGGDGNLESQTGSGGGGELKNPEENQGDIPVSGGQEAERVNDYGSDNDSQEEKEEPIFPLLENYRERGIEIAPDIDGKGERYCGVLLNRENKIEYYTVSTRQENGYFLFCYTLNDETLTWEREAVTWSKGFKEKVQQDRINVLLGEDGCYYAWYADEDQRFHLVRQEGDGFREIIIPDWDKTEERDYYMIPGRVGVMANGNIVMAHQGKECTVYSPEDGRVLDRFRCGWYESMCVSGNELFMIAYDTPNVMHYDGETLSVLPEIEGNFKAMLRPYVRGEDIVALSPDGVFMAKKSGGRFQKVLDSGKFYFSRESGNPLVLLVVGEDFYVAYGESGVALKKYSKRKPDEKFLGELTVYSLDNNDMVLDIIAQFQMRHPDIDVFYETGEGAEGSTTAADHIRALNARILSGDGPDILVLDGLPADSYREKGILADMGAALAPLREELLDNILAVYEEKEGIYMLPFCVEIPMFGISERAEGVENSLMALADYWEEGNERGAYFAALPSAYYLGLLYYNFQPEFALPGGSVKKEEIAEFLKDVKRLFDASQKFSSGFDDEYADRLYEFYSQKKIESYFNGITYGEEDYLDGESNFLFYNIEGIYGLSNVPYILEQQGGELVSNSLKFFPNGMLGINAKTKERELAELFIREAFSYEIQDECSFFEGFPLHKKVLLENEKKDLSFITHTSGDRSLGHSFTSQDAKKIIDMVRLVNTPVEKNQIIFEIIEEEACAFFAGEKSLDAAAEEIANRLSLYYLEQ